MSKSLRLVPLFLSICSLHGIAQDPPVKKLSESPDSLPIERTLADVSPDDPVMQAIRERAGLSPSKTPNTSEVTSKPTRKSADRWRIAERLLRRARMIERDADSLEQLGDVDAAGGLRQLVATTREQVLRILRAAPKPLEESREPNLPLKKAIP